MTSLGQVLGILDRLIAFESISTSSNLSVIDYAKDMLQAAGFTVHLLPDTRGTKAGLVARAGPDVPGGVVLSGHTDVVPVEGQTWSSNPFQLVKRGSRLYGRGTTDMKGFVACILAMAQGLQPDTLRVPVTIVLSYDEERGCLGIREMAPLLPLLLGQPRLCIVGEPTNMGVATGHKGKAVWAINCKGQAGHSAMAPNYCNALHLATDAVTAIRKVQEHLKHHGAHDTDYIIPYSTLHVASVHGGGPVNIVPADARVVFECRHLPGDSSGAIVGHVKSHMERSVEAMSHLAAAYDIEDINSYPGLSIAKDHEAVVETLALTGKQGTAKVDCGTEAGFFSELGIPTVVCGPGSMAQGHQPDEFIEEAEIASCLHFLEGLFRKVSS